MKHKTINTIILATALSVAGLTHAVASNTESATATTQDTIIIQEDGRDKQRDGKHRGDKQRGGKHHGKMMFKKLDLSDAQKEQMKTIMTAHKEANKESRSEYKANMKALMDAPAFDEEQAQTLIAEREAQRADKELSMLKMKHEMYQVLTDEQKVKYDQRETRKMQRENRANN